MTLLTFEGATFEVAQGESVLDTLLRNDIDVPYSCRKGTCGTCRVRSTAGAAPPAAAQAGFRASQRAQGLFHACQCVPIGDMEVARPDAAEPVEAVVESKVMLAPTVCRLRLKLPASFNYHAGQSILLQRSDGLTRSYSLASVPHLDEHAELHVRLFENGAMSRWIFEDVAPGVTLSVRGPFGDCMYMPGAEEGSMLLLATGTGFAPIVAIARDALSRGHLGRIVIVHGVRDASDAYSREVLDAVAAAYPNVETMLCVSRGDAPAGFFPGRAVDVAFERFPDLGRWRVFLCGAPAAVAAAKKEAYLAGARMDDIYADAFEQSARRS